MVGAGPLYAGIELGGTKCIGILARTPDDIIGEIRLPTALPADTLPALRHQLDAWRERYEIAALGIASFGPLDLHPDSPTHGHIIRTTKEGWSDMDLIGSLVPPGLNARLDTDVNGAALAEGRWGAARRLSTFAYITVGTGVGVGSIVSRRTIVGLGHSEAGHLRVPRREGDAWPGACFYHGDCVEGLASGPALRAASGMDPATLDFDHPVMERAAQALAHLCHNLVLTTSPERILIGGGVAAARPEWLERIRALLIESLGPYAWADRIADDPDFLSSPALGNRAGPLGAIALAADAAREQGG